MGTLFTNVYDRFFGKITDDMYLELTPRDTLKDLRQLLKDAIPGFEFPKQVLTYHLDYEVIDPSSSEGLEIIDLDETHTLNAAVEDGIIDLNEDVLEDAVIVDTSYFDATLTEEEENILALLMMCAWLQRQVTSIENTRMKYSGTD